MIVVFGVLVYAISIWWALAIWGYAAAELLLLNVIKVLAYRWVIGHSHRGQAATAEIRTGPDAGPQGH